MFSSLKSLKVFPKAYIQFDLNSTLLHFQSVKVSLGVSLQGLNLNIFLLFYSETSANLFQYLRLIYPQPTKVRGISLLYRFPSSPWDNRAGLPTSQGSVLRTASQLRQAEAFGYLSNQLARQGSLSLGHRIKARPFYGDHWSSMSCLPTSGFMPEFPSAR